MYTICKEHCLTVGMDQEEVVIIKYNVSQLLDLDTPIITRLGIDDHTVHHGKKGFIIYGRS